MNTRNTSSHTTAATSNRFRQLTALLLLAAGTVASGFAASREQHTGDVDIEEAIEVAFFYDSSVPFHAIDIQVADGVATLKGEVDSLFIHDRTIRIAESIRGVIGVVDLLTIQPDDLSDQEVREFVDLSLKLDPAVDEDLYSVSVSDGNVTLSGTATSHREVELAELAARRIQGARSVSMDVQVNPPSQRSDDAIAAEIAESLRWSIWIDHEFIEISVTEGVVTVSGSVGSMAEKRMVERESKVSGVKQVNLKNLRVDRLERIVERRTVVRPPLSNNSVADAVRKTISRDPRIDSSDLRVGISAGVATLRGTVTNNRARLAAEQTAQNTVGVRSVINLLKVRPHGVYSDKQIAEWIEDELKLDPILEHSEINVAVINGRAFISGTVDTSLEKSQANRATSRIDGVTEVLNNLKVGYPSLRFYPQAYDPYFGYTRIYWPDNYDSHDTDAEILRAVERELWWSPFVDSDEVDVTVEDGVVTLEGRVDTFSEYKSATENAWEGGARKVFNRIEFSES